jgi:acyl-CoA thioester hydrolase
LKRGLADIAHMTLSEIQHQSHRSVYRVIYADTDNMGVAYHGNYLRWFEIGRTELLRHWGLPYRRIEAQGVMLPVSEAYCRYLKPVRYDEQVIIETTIDPTIKGALKCDYRILRHEDQELVATGYTKHAYVNGEGRVIRPPRFLVELLHQHLSETYRED